MLILAKQMYNCFGPLNDRTQRVSRTRRNNDALRNDVGDPQQAEDRKLDGATVEAVDRGDADPALTTADADCLAGDRRKCSSGFRHVFVHPPTIATVFPEAETAR